MIEALREQRMSDDQIVATLIDRLRVSEAEARWMLREHDEDDRSKA